MKQFQKLLAQSMLWRGIYFATVILLNILLARSLGAASAGWVYYLTNIFTIVSLVASFNLVSGINYYAANQKIDATSLYWFSLASSLFATLITIVAVFFYFNTIQQTAILTRNTLLFFAGAYVAGILITDMVAVQFYARSNFWIPNLLMSLVQLVLCTFIWLKQNGFFSQAYLVTVYFATFLCTALVMLFVYAIIYKIKIKPTFPNWAQLKWLFKYALLSLAANLLFLLVYRIDYWFVHKSSTASEEDLGNYIMASKLGQMLLIIPQIMASAIFPQTASGINRVEINSSLGTVARLMALLYIVLIVFLAATGKYLLPFLFGSSYSNMYWPMLILLPGMFALSVLSLLSAYFSGKGNLRINILGAFIALAFVIVGNICFTNQYGIVAAAIISSIAYIINMLVSLRQFKRDYEIGIKDFLFLRKADFVWLKHLFTKDPNHA
jgi:O-antigen/teichoic acid export membrane protein